MSRADWVGVAILAIAGALEALRRHYARRGRAQPGAVKAANVAFSLVLLVLLTSLPFVALLLLSLAALWD